MTDWANIAQEETDRGPGEEAINPGESHLALLFLLDTSGSMSLNNNIDAVSDALTQFHEELMADDVAKRRVDVSLITFNSTVDILQDWAPASEMITPRLTATGGTHLGEAVLRGIERVHVRNEYYDQNGIPHFKPFIIIITDGAATDSITEAAEAVRRVESQGTYGHLRVWAFAVKGANLGELKSITERVVGVKDYEFSKIFNWASSTMKNISRSKPTAEASPANLPEGFTPITSTSNYPDVWNA